jgi:hypothetical protein
MKKNKFMRLASCLLVGTLLTTCAISGTFAKYTTQDAAADSARVAKWGVELQIIGDLYGQSYVEGELANSVPTDWAETDNGVSVRASANTESELVAPGTKSNGGLSIKLNGKPEVDYQLWVTMKTDNVFLQAGNYGVLVAVDAGTVNEENWSELKGQLYAEVADGYKLVATDANFDVNATYYTLEDYVENTADYYPVIYNIKGAANDLVTDNKDADKTDDTLEEIALSIATQLKGAELTSSEKIATDGQVTENTYVFKSVVYDTNKDLADLKISDLNLDWFWTFTDVAGAQDPVTGEVTNAGDAADLDDKLDTILGNLHNGSTAKVVMDDNNDGVFASPVEGTDYNLETAFELDITVNQID